MFFEFTKQADDWLDNEQDESIRKTVVDWIVSLEYTSPDPEDWVGIPIEDGISRTAFVPGTDVAVTYFVWHDLGVVFIDLIESIPALPPQK